MQFKFKNQINLIVNVLVIIMHNDVQYCSYLKLLIICKLDRVRRFKYLNCKVHRYSCE